MKEEKEALVNLKRDKRQLEAIEKCKLKEALQALRSAPESKAAQDKLKQYTGRSASASKINLSKSAMSE